MSQSARETQLAVLDVRHSELQLQLHLIRRIKWIPSML